MDQPLIFGLAAQRTDWLAAKQAAIAGNIANANTPGYKAREIVPFKSVLDSTDVGLTTTNPMHVSLGGSDETAATKMKPTTDSWDTTPTGNSVSVEQELVKAGNNSKDYSLATSIVRSMQQMWLMGVRT